MQTFMPYSNFAAIATILDQKRLGKQRVETLQIMTTLVTGRSAWANHPAVLMWGGFEWGLLEYQRAICHEWTEVRGFKDTCYEKTREVYETYLPMWGPPELLPTWLNDHDVLESHQSNLIRKDPDYYRPIFPGVPDNLEYVWPVDA